MKKLTSVFVLSVLMVSCKQNQIPAEGNNFYFENPQPINDSELSSIPNKFKGIYRNADSLYLNITNDIIFSERGTKFRFHKNELDSLQQYFDVANGKYISKDKKEIFNSKQVGDSIDFHLKILILFLNFQIHKKQRE